jgi:hypothetical protein
MEGATMESLSDDQRTEIDVLILAGSIVVGMGRIMKACGVGLVEARSLFRARYRQLRIERDAEFASANAEYWSSYGEDLSEAIAQDW